MPNEPKLRKVSMTLEALRELDRAWDAFYDSGVPILTIERYPIRWEQLRMAIERVLREINIEL